MTTELLEDIPDGAMIVHEPHGFVKLVEQNANDLMVVNAARVSFSKRSEWANQAELDEAERLAEWYPDEKLFEADEKLVQFLLKNKHGTPFEHTFFAFHIRAPIFVFREWHRHRIGVSINEESGRYVELRGDFYLPDDEHVRIQKGKPGRYTYESYGNELIPVEVDAKFGGRTTYGEATRDSLDRAYDQAYKSYQYLMSIGVAKEIARACLPVGIYSQMYWTCNARSLMNFLALRNHEKALQEIREYAEAMESVFAELMPVTHAAFVENGRVAP